MLHPHMTEEEIVAQSKEMKLRMMVVGSRALPADFSELEDEACSLRLQLLQELALTLDSRPSAAISNLLKWTIENCDRDTAEATMVDILDKGIFNDRNGYFVEGIVKQLNLWHDLNLGRLGAVLVNQQNPALSVINWQEVADQVVEWSRTGHDPMVTPEGYNIKQGDLRIVWKQLENPEESWIDIWRMPSQGKNRIRRQLLWKQERPQGYGGVYVYFWILADAENGQEQYRVSTNCNGLGKMPFTLLPSQLPCRIGVGPIRSDAQGNKAPIAWELWIEDALAQDSVIASTEILRQWQENPSCGLRFATDRMVTIPFSADRSYGKLRHHVQPAVVAQGDIELPVWADIYMELQDVELTDPVIKALNRCKSTSVNLRKVNLEQSSLSALTQLQNLCSLSMPDVVVPDERMKEIGRIGSLTQLHFKNPSITADGLAELLGLPQLETLGLVSGTMKKEKLRHIGGIQSLEVLYLEILQVHGSALAQLKDLKKLRHLSLSRAQLSGDPLASLSELPNLQALILNNSNVDDRMLAGCAKGGFLKLKTLSLRGCSITDQGLDYLKGLQTLRSLDVSKSSISSAAIKELKDAIPGLKVNL